MKEKILTYAELLAFQKTHKITYKEGLIDGKFYILYY